MARAAHPKAMAPSGPGATRTAPPTAPAQFPMQGRYRAYTLFATHYFELTALAERLPHVANVHLDAVEHADRIVFLHAVKPGPANRSYGLQVAALAGLPRTVIGQAREHLEGLEAAGDLARDETPQLALFAPAPVAPAAPDTTTVCPGSGRPTSSRPK